ncbi:MAG: hypothetical protein O7A68_08790 [Alphaproteobacteria bacterium]|nr:hypothetical protein [Alphaproteobacteria bacterium]
MTRRGLVVALAGLLCVVGCVVGAGPAAAQALEGEAVGMVSRLRGQAVAVNRGQSRRLAAGLRS